MHIAAVIAWMILIGAVAYFAIRYMAGHKAPKHNTLLIIATGLTAVAATVLLMLSSMIPGQADRLIESTLTKVEDRMALVSPDFATTEVDATNFRELIADTRQVTTYLDDNEQANFLVSLLGARAYVAAADMLCDNIDQVFADFEQTQTPFTPHNLFNYLQEQSQEPVRKATAIIETVILVLTGLLLVFLFFFHTALCKGWIRTDNGVVFGEDITDEPA